LSTRLALVLALALAACGAEPQARSDWERDHEESLSRESRTAEAAPQFPAYPRKASLIEFFVSAASDFRFFVDAETLDVGSDGIVRYVLVARSPAGVENASFEGMHCASGEFRRYALGRADGTWAVSAAGGRPIPAAAVQRWHRTLQREYFCPQRQPIRSAAEGVRALQQGGHPFAKGFDGDALRERR